VTVHSAVGAFTGTGSFGISGFDYATVVNGVVTAITLGASSIPANTATTLYVDITSYSPQPQVGWFYDELCDVFTPSPPTIPPGSIAPPVPPGGTYPPGTVLPPSIPPIVPPPDTIPVHVHFHANGAAAYPTLTDMPSLRTPLSDMMHTAFDASRCYAVTLHTTVATVGTSCSRLAVEYCIDPNAGSPVWLPMAEQRGPFVKINALGSHSSLQRYLVDPLMRAAGDVWLRVVSEGGDGVADPVVYNIHLIAYMAMDPQALTTPILQQPSAPIHPSAFCADDYQGSFSGVPNYVDEDEFDVFHGANILWQAGAQNNRIGPGGETVWAFEDNYFDAHRAIVSYHGNNDAASGTIVGIGISGSLTKGPKSNPASSWDDVWLRAALEVECGFNLPNDGTGVAALTGLRLIQLGHFNFHGGGQPDTLGMTSAQFKLSNNEFRLVVTHDTNANGLTTVYTKYTLGPASDIIGRGMQDIIVHSKRITSTQWRIRVYIGKPGAIDIPRYAEVTHNVPSSTNDDLITGYAFLQDILPALNINVARKRTWIGRWDFIAGGTNPYQVIP
jgi:hypothetical protein